MPAATSGLVVVSIASPFPTKGMTENCRNQADDHGLGKGKHPEKVTGSQLGAHAEHDDLYERHHERAELEPGPGVKGGRIKHGRRYEGGHPEREGKGRIVAALAHGYGQQAEQQNHCRSDEPRRAGGQEHRDQKDANQGRKQAGATGAALGQDRPVTLV